MSNQQLHLPNPRWYALVRGFARFAFWLLTRTTIRGLENLPPRGPYIVVTNHLSAIDPPLILASIPTCITVFAADTHRHELFVGELMNALGAIWVRRGEVDRESLRSALDVLTAGGVIGMAPEGTRSRTGGLLEGKIGAAYLANRADVPLVPVALAGTDVGLPSVFRLTRPRLTLTLGKPFRLPNADPRADRQQLQSHTELIMRTLAAMLPEKLRGVYRDSV
jgi:1-acyl-sn-glycerol-3-phosphate acyltransferase